MFCTFHKLHCSIHKSPVVSPYFLRRMMWNGRFFIILVMKHVRNKRVIVAVSPAFLISSIMLILVASICFYFFLLFFLLPFFLFCFIRFIWGILRTQSCTPLCRRFFSIHYNMKRSRSSCWCNYKSNFQDTNALNKMRDYNFFKPFLIFNEIVKLSDCVIHNGFDQILPLSNQSLMRLFTHSLKKYQSDNW